MRRRSAINAFITAAFVTLYLLLGDWLGRIILVALILFFAPVSTYAGFRAPIQIVKQILGNRGRG
jgi:hypothetical protein